jgi:hypothetical protein
MKGNGNPMARNPQQSPKGKKQASKQATTSGTSWLHQSANWPVYEVLLSEDWDKERAIPTIVVARQSPRSGKIAAAAFMVDLGCTGVKSAFVRICKSPDDYARRLREPLLKDQEFATVELDMAAKIIAEGIAYAERLGFAPDPEYRQASRLIADANPDACPEEIPLGSDDGRPLYVPGPHDNVEQALTTLTRAVGPDGFQVYMQEHEKGKREQERLAEARHEPPATL